MLPAPHEVTFKSCPVGPPNIEAHGAGRHGDYHDRLLIDSVD